MADGHLNICKQCRHIDGLAYYAKTRARQLATKAEWRAQNAERKRAMDAEYRARPGNAEKQRAYNRDYYKKHSGKLKSYQAEYRSQNPDKISDRNARYRTANRDRLRAWHAANGRTAKRKRQDAIKHAIRRARVTAAGVIPFTDEELRAKFQFWNDCCWVCGEAGTAVDHVKPIAAGGGHVLANLRPICGSCNSRKSSKWPLLCRAQILGFCS